MPDNVRCTVSSCVFWGEQNRCIAEEILIIADEAANSSDFEIASLEQTPTTTSARTACKTFKPKNA